MKYEQKLDALDFRYSLTPKGRLHIMKVSWSYKRKTLKKRMKVIVSYIHNEMLQVA